MIQLLFATNNQHKLREIREIAGDRLKIQSLEEIGFREEIPETGDTLHDNARQKAWYVYERTGRNCFADDTGLFIDALDGRPGVYSARYAGEGCTFHDNVVKVLKELEGISNRRASFRCSVCLIVDGHEWLFSGSVEGSIVNTEKGTEGFGYDPVFVPEGFDRTFAELNAEEKNAISHRGRAIRAMLDSRIL